MSRVSSTPGAAYGLNQSGRHAISWLRSCSLNPADSSHVPTSGKAVSLYSISNTILRFLNVVRSFVTPFAISVSETAPSISVTQLDGSPEVEMTA